MAQQEKRTIQRQFGQRAREMRLQRGWTQQELADRMGIDWKGLGQIERGERNLTLRNVGRLSEALEVKPYQLFFFGEREFVSRPRVKEEWLRQHLDNATADVRAFVHDIAALAVRYSKARRR